ncbi:MAG: citrate lyase holo-[acyl-carrier protein] synthase [Synergistales bacterium]|nr:citrate lyase holo-[acyl-carrier protein] synthase [Synergistales bacterium]
MLEKVLAARESRWEKRLFLARYYRKTVVTLTMNIPGSDKTRDIYISAHERIMEDFIDFLQERNIALIHLESRVDADGPECIMVVDLPALTMKGNCISFEDSHPLGRLIDSDVMDGEGNCRGRSDLGLPPRKCLICNEPARECIVLRRHPKEEVIRKVEIMISDFLE